MYNKIVRYCSIIFYAILCLSFIFVPKFFTFDGLRILGTIMGVQIIIYTNMLLSKE